MESYHLSRQYLAYFEYSVSAADTDITPRVSIK